MVGCLYIPEFPAWALQQQWRDRHALAVYHDGRIIARSRFLCQAGMHLGDPLDRARTLFPEATFFDQDIPYEQAVWEEVLQRINEVTPYVESLERGVAFFRPYSFSEARLLAEQFIVRVGLGPDKSVARIAGVRSAPGAALKIPAEAVVRFLSRTNVVVLDELGFDEEIPSRLELFGLTTLNMVRALTRQHLLVQFGPAGLALFRLLHPPPEATSVPVYVPPAVITEVLTLDSAADNLLLLERLLTLVVRRALLRLGRLCCNHLTLRLQSINNRGVPRLARRALKSPTSDPGIIGRAAAYMLRRVLRDPVEVSSIEITLAGLENPIHVQTSLFFERPPLGSAIERLEERFPGSIRRAQLVHPDAPFPEDAVRFVPFSESLPHPS